MIAATFDLSSVIALSRLPVAPTEAAGLKDMGSAYAAIGPRW
jgi:hypothetical protein